MGLIIPAVPGKAEFWFRQKLLSVEISVILDCQCPNARWKMIKGLK